MKKKKMSQGSFLHSIEKTWSGPLDPRGFPCWACGKLSRCPQAVSSWKGRGSPARQVSHLFGLPKIRRLIPFIPPSQAFDTEPETETELSKSTDTSYCGIRVWMQNWSVLEQPLYPALYQIKFMFPERCACKLSSPLPFQHRGIT